MCHSFFADNDGIIYYQKIAYSQSFTMDTSGEKMDKSKHTGQSVQFTLPMDSLSPRHHSSAYIDSPDGIHVRARTINDFEVVYIESGTGMYRILDQRIVFSGGDCIVTPPWVEHEYRSTGSSTAYWYVHFSMVPGLEDAYEKIKTRNLAVSQISIRSDSGPAIPLFFHDFPSEHVGLFRAIRSRAIESDSVAPVTGALRMKELLLQMVAVLFERDAAARSGRAFEKSLQHINERLAETITVEELAKMEGVTKEHYSSAFKKRYGVPPSEFIVRKRLSSAKGLLAAGGLTVKEIAYRCGFPDQYYFSRVFSRREGMPPSRYHAF
jgi:AraC-like DNA-binding protein/mannose-6-phosphate isomerase-like protein (cupin superfamily)